MIYNPYEYQKRATQKILDTPYVGLFLGMGLGKTSVTLTAVNELIYQRFEIARVLVVAPLAVAQDTWSRESEKWDHLKHLKVAKILGSAKKRQWQRRAMRTSMSSTGKILPGSSTSIGIHGGGIW